MNKIKLTEDRYPVLSALQWGKPLNEHPKWCNKANPYDTVTKFMGIVEERYSPKYNQLLGILSHISDKWDVYGPGFASNIEYISDGFSSSLASVKDTLWNPELVKEFIDQWLYGTIIYKDVVYMYALCIKEVVPDEATSECYYSTNGVLICTINNKVALAIDTGASQNSYLNESFFNGQIDDPVALAMRDVFVLHLFKKYGQVQVVEAQPHKKTTTPTGTFMVDAGIAVNHLDCTWLTTIVRGEGFKVRGHFRLQPYKENGEWTKRLIYIKEFEKHGYTRRAQKLIELGEDAPEIAMV